MSQDFPVVPKTLAEQIIKAAREVVGTDRNRIFAPIEIRKRLAVSGKEWRASYGPVFQGMRVDQPGGAPIVGSRFKNVFQQVSHGQHVVTSYGWQLISATEQGGLNSSASCRNWLTTQWPPEVGNSDLHRNVYLQEGHESVGATLAPGDKVLIYEAGSGPTEVEDLPDGSKRSVRKRPGRQGIVTAAEVKEPLIRRSPKDALVQYADGSTKNWAWMATTERHSSNGFVPVRDLLRILGLAENYTMRGFGPKKSGLREITKSQYDELLKVFVSHPQNKAIAPTGKNARPGHWTEGGGEGDVHLALKEYVAANPCVVLSEDGVVTIRMEFPFPSGDRADIALRDGAGRFIGLEVEVEQDDEDFEGTLQAVKYRFMLAVMQGVSFEETRSVLVAYRVSQGIKQLCKKYDVQVIELDRATVAAWTIARRTNPASHL